jgi:hypothetical protein
VPIHSLWGGNSTPRPFFFRLIGSTINGCEHEDDEKAYSSIVDRRLLKQENMRRLVARFGKLITASFAVMAIGVLVFLLSLPLYAAFGIDKT